MVEPKLGLKTLTNLQVQQLLGTVATAMAKVDAAAIFTEPDPALSMLAADATLLESLLQQQAELKQQGVLLTQQIRDARTQGETHLTAEAGYVGGKANGNPTTIMLAGMGVSDATNTPVGPMPKVENLHAAQGDADGEVDLNWDAILRGLTNGRVEMTTDPAGLTGWAFKMNAGGKSKCTVTGLTSGTRYWFRVIAEGAGPEGPPSDPVTKVAP